MKSKNKKRSCFFAMLLFLFLNIPAASGLQVNPLPPATPLQIIKTQHAVLRVGCVIVPKIEKLSLREAVLKLRRLGLKAKITKEKYHPVIPKGSVISQTPPPAQTVPEKSTIEVVLSKGPAPMPNLKGKRWDTAVKILTGKRSKMPANLAPYHLKIIRKNVSSKHAPETIVDQIPKTGSPLAVADKITLFVSKGDMLPQRTRTPRIKPETTSHGKITKPSPILQPPLRSLEAQPLSDEASPALHLAREIRIHKKQIPAGTPLRLLLKEKLLRQNQLIFFIGSHKVLQRRSRRRGEILLPTRGISPGTYPLVAKLKTNKEVIGRIRITKNRSKDTSPKTKSERHEKNLSKSEKSRKPSLQSPAQTQTPKTSHQKTKSSCTFIFTIENHKLSQFKDILLKEAPWMKIKKKRRLKSLKIVIISIRTTEPEKTKKLAKRLISRKIIKSYQISHTYRTFGTTEDPFVSREYGCQPSQRLINIQGSCSGQGIQVALLDTGVDIYHEDLNEKAIETKDFTEEGLGRFLTDIHGTALCGIIAAIPNNGKGIMGIAPGVKLYAIKVCRRTSPDAIKATTDSFTLAEGLDYAIQKRVHIINVSIGGPRDKIIEKLIRKARASGITVVAAVGNGGPRSPPTYPAAYPGVIGVTAINQKLKLYPRAPHGPFVDVAAPGVDVFSLKPGNRYNFYTGTSFAAAYVTGLLALRLSCVIDAHHSIAKDPFAFLRSLAYKPPSYSPDEMGAGVLIFSKISKKAFLQ